jgi:hypothetical protein
MSEEVVAMTWRLLACALLGDREGMRILSEEFCTRQPAVAVVEVFASLAKVTADLMAERNDRGDMIELVRAELLKGQQDAR